MNQAIDAVYEHGTFRVLNASAPLLEEGQRIRLIIETVAEIPEDLLSLAAQVYDGLSSEEIDEVEHIALDRRDFFGGEARQ